MKIGMKNSLCVLLLVLVLVTVSINFAVCCLFLLFVARSCFEIESVVSQKPKQINAFALVLAFCFSFSFVCRCFHLNIVLLILVFCWQEKPK